MRHHREEPADRLAHPVRPRPAHLVPPDVAQGHGIEDRLDDVGQEHEPVARVRDAAAELVVVGQVVGDGREAADPLQRRSLDRDRRAEGVAEGLHPLRHQRVRHEVRVDEERLDDRRQPEVAAASIEAGHETHGRVGERPDHGPEIVRTHADVAVAHHQHVVARVGHHVLETRDLAVRAVPAPDRQDDLAFRKIAPQALDHRDGRVAGVGDAEDDLVRRIALPAEAREVLVELDAEALERLQHRDRWQDAGPTSAARPAEETPRGHDLEELIPGCDRRAGQDGGDDEAHDGGTPVSRPLCAIRRRFAIEPMNWTPSPRSRFASSRLDAIFLTAFQMYRGRK